jgi:hypothetical protein
VRVPGKAAREDGDGGGLLPLGPGLPGIRRNCRLDREFDERDFGRRYGPNMEHCRE